jgi:acyl carrier protein
MRDKSETVPLGRAIANTQIYILNHYLQPVPIGVTGELYIGGDSLARGYLNQPKLTSERFIRNPFSIQNSKFKIQNTDSERLYKTGDLARYLPDGNIEFIGRSDHQVKIRGFRIELGEIEATLRQHPEVQEVVVLDREDESGEKRLVAYVVSSQNQASISTSELHRFLKEKLPEPMVPSALVLLKALPLTPNGKVNRQALPAPHLTRSHLDAIYVAPRGPVEERLAIIWTQVLGVEQVGIHDNFFELGGHSLLATQIIYRVREAFQMELSLRNLFEKPTVAGMAECIDRIRAIAQKLQTSTSTALGDCEEIEL